MDPQAQLVEGGAEAQARQALDNLRHVLEAGGASLDSVVKCTILLDKMEDFQAVNQVYSECKYLGITDMFAKKTMQNDNVMSNNIKLFLFSIKTIPFPCPYPISNKLRSLIWLLWEWCKILEHKLMTDPRKGTRKSRSFT